MDPSQVASLPLGLISFIFISSASADQRNLTAEPGQDTTLPCRAPDGGPIIVLIWRRPDLGPKYVFLYRNGHIDLGNQDFLFKNRVDLQNRQFKDGDVSLVLRNVTTDDTGIYECRMVQTVTDSRTETVFIINLDVCPPPGDGGTKDGDVGLRVGLGVSLGFVLFLLGILAGVCYKKRKKRLSEERKSPEESRHSVELESQKSLMGQNGTAQHF